MPAAPDPAEDIPPLAYAPMPSAEGLVEPLRSRWSPSVFDAEHRLTTDEVETLLHAAQWAPSSGNCQPWRFVVCERGDAAHQLLVPHLSRGNSGWVPRASVVFVACSQVAPDPDNPDAYVEPETADYVVGQAVAHLTLQAHAMGLWVHQFSGFDREGLTAAFGVPEHLRLLAGIAVGVRGNPEEVSERDQRREHKVRRRKPLAKIAFGGTWGAPWSGLEGDRPN